MTMLPDPVDLRHSSQAEGALIGRCLRAISCHTFEIEKKAGKALGLNITDIAAVEHLLNDGPLRPSQLAEHLGVTTAAATQIVDRLERIGHVRRESQAGDKRMVLVVPVEGLAARYFAQLCPVHGALNSLLSVLSQDERLTIETFLDKVVEAYRVIADSPALNVCPAPGSKES